MFLQIIFPEIVEKKLKFFKLKDLKIYLILFII